MAFQITEAELEKTEATLGMRFPEGFRKSMMANNGGVALTETDQWELHPFRDSTDRKRLSRTCNDILLETESAKKWRGFPDSAVAIAGNGLGDVMIFLPSESRPGHLDSRVFVFWHDGPDVAVLASDFSELRT